MSLLLPIASGLHITMDQLKTAIIAFVDFTPLHTQDIVLPGNSQEFLRYGIYRVGGPHPL